MKKIIKKAISIAIIVALIIGAIPFGTLKAEAATKAFTFQVKVTDSDLRIRSGAGTNYTNKGYIPRGTYEIIAVSTGTGSKAGWGKLANGKGWISLDYAKRTASSYVVTVTDSDLRMRTGAGTNYTNKGYIPRGTYTITDIKPGQGSTRGWGYVKEKKYWISLDYVSLGTTQVTSSNTVNGPSTLAISKGSYPSGTLTQGDSFSIGGAIKSNYNITAVTVGVFYTNGTATAQVMTVNPNTTSYNISSVDKYIKFGSLAAGNYIFKVSARDAKGVLRTAESSFTVKKPSVDKNAQSIANKVYERQGSQECILTSISMVVKGRLCVEGKSYSKINKAVIRNYNGGLYCNWNRVVDNVNRNAGTTAKLKHEYISGKSAAANKNRIINLLKNHPEGIVVYFYMNDNNQHAVKFCNYDVSTGTFYVSDPGNSNMKYVKMQNSLLGNGYYRWGNANNAFNYANHIVYFG